MWPSLILAAAQEVLFPAIRQALDTAPPASVQASVTTAKQSAEEVAKQIVAALPDQSKPWYLSKGVIGGVGSIVAGILMIAGVDTVDATDGVNAALGAIAGLSGVVAVWGRIAAKGPLK